MYQLKLGLSANGCESISVLARNNRQASRFRRSARWYGADCRARQLRCRTRAAAIRLQVSASSETRSLVSLGSCKERQAASLGTWRRRRIIGSCASVIAQGSASGDWVRPSMGLRMLHTWPQREQWKYTATSVRSATGFATAWQYGQVDGSRGREPARRSGSGRGNSRLFLDHSGRADDPTLQFDALDFDVIADLDARARALLEVSRRRRDHGAFL